MAESSLFWYGKISDGAPGDAGGYSDDQFAEFVKVIFEHRTGILSGLRVTPTSPASKSIQVAAGSGALRGRIYLNTDVRILALDDNTSGSTRIDRIVVRVDYAAQTVRVAVLKGTPGAGAPPLTRNEGTTWEESLAQVSLANGFATIVEGDITRERTWIRSAAPGDTKFSFTRQSQEPDWLLCDGRAVSRTTYADLFDAIGTDHGAGDGSTTFNLPDMRGRAPAGMDDMDTPAGSANVITAGAADSPGGKYGTETHTLTASEIPPHTHPYYYYTAGSGGLQTGTNAYNQSPVALYTGQNAGGGGAHNNVQPTIFGYMYVKS